MVCRFKLVEGNVAEKFNISFKKEPRETGLRSVGYPYQNVNIKVNKRKCGWIQAPSWSHSGWSVRVAVQSDATRESPCDFKWRQASTSFATEQEAREWVNSYLKSIHDKHPLFFFDDDE